MQISVIIPAYNAAKYITKAIESALQFEEVKEIIVVEDKSPDNCLEICQKLAENESRIKIFQHPDKKNHGAGPTRNLGMEMATCEFIAFLDADDFFLPNRFDAEKEIFKNNPEIDGVYGGLGVHYYSEEAKQVFLESNDVEFATIKERIEPEKTFFGLVGVYPKWRGYYSIDAMTIRKEGLEKMNDLMSYKLRLHQDTDFIIRYAYYNKMAPGIIEKPVAVRGVHSENRITSSNNSFTSRKLMYEHLLNWYKTVDNPKRIVEKKFESDFKFNQFLDENPSASIGKTIRFARKNKYIFYNDMYFQYLMDYAKGSKKLKSFLVRLKEKIILVFLKKKKEKYRLEIKL